MQIRVSNGKYTFVSTTGDRPIEILRGGEPWHEQHDAANALRSIMCELDAARLVLESVRADIADGHLSEMSRTGRALKAHGQLVDDRESPSEWAR